MELAPDGGPALFFMPRSGQQPERLGRAGAKVFGVLRGIFPQKIPLSGVQGQRPCQGLELSPKVLLGNAWQAGPGAPGACNFLSHGVHYRYRAVPGKSTKQEW